MHRARDGGNVAHMSTSPPKITKAGSIPIKKTGHTFSGQHGSNPNAKVKGRSGEPTEMTFG